MDEDIVSSLRFLDKNTRADFVYLYCDETTPEKYVKESIDYFENTAENNFKAFTIAVRSRQGTFKEDISRTGTKVISELEKCATLPDENILQEGSIKLSYSAKGNLKTNFTTENLMDLVVKMNSQVVSAQFRGKRGATIHKIYSLLLSGNVAKLSGLDTKSNTLFNRAIKCSEDYRTFQGDPDMHMQASTRFQAGKNSSGYLICKEHKLWSLGKEFSEKTGCSKHLLYYSLNDWRSGSGKNMKSLEKILTKGFDAGFQQYVWTAWKDFAHDYSLNLRLDSLNTLLKHKHEPNMECVLSQYKIGQKFAEKMNKSSELTDCVLERIAKEKPLLKKLCEISKNCYTDKDSTTKESSQEVLKTNIFKNLYDNPKFFQVDSSYSSMERLNLARVVAPLEDKYLKNAVEGFFGLACLAEFAGLEKESQELCALSFECVNEDKTILSAARIAKLTGLKEESEKAYDRAIKLFKEYSQLDSPKDHLNLGLLYEEAGQYSSAIHEYEHSWNFDKAFSLGKKTCLVPQDKLNEYELLSTKVSMKDIIERF